MDVSRLPFDDEAMLEGLRAWVETESPTFDARAVTRMVGLAAREMAQAGGQVERIDGAMGFGDCARIRFPHPRAGEPGILVLAHLDTVHPVGEIERLPWRREGDKCFGPGILDMKGGTYLALEAVRQLAKAGIVTPLPVTFLLTSEEEVGTPANRSLIEAEARRNRYVLIPEPGRGDGEVVTGRYAIARFMLEAKGRPSHAGAHLKDGRSALSLMARKLVEIEEMTDEDCTFSVSVLHCGQWVNCVPSDCTAEALSMAKRQADLDRGVEAMLAKSGTFDGVSFTVTRSVTRPVWEPNAEGLKLYELARDIAADTGVELDHASAGGGSDGNFTGAMGIPTLDGLGARGRGPHTLDEHIIVDSLSERGRIFAGLLATLDT